MNHISDKPESLTNSLFFAFAATLGTIVLTLLTGVLIARVLGPEDRGVYGTLQFVVQAIALYVFVGVPEAALIRARRLKIDPKRIVPIVMRVACVASALGFVGLLGLNHIGLKGLGTTGLTPYLLIMWMLLSSMVFNTGLISVETASLEFKRLNVERLLSPGLFVLLVYALWLVGKTSIAIILTAFLISKLPLLILRLWRYRRNLFSKPDFVFLLGVAKLSPRLFVSKVALDFGEKIDKYIVIAIWNPTALGYYFVAQSTIGASMSAVTQALNLTLMPYLAGAAEQSRDLLIARLFRLSLIAGIVIGVLIYVAAPYLIPLVFGQPFAPAAGYAQGLVFAFALMPAFSIVIIANRALERARPGVEIAVVNVVVMGGFYVATGFKTVFYLFLALFVTKVVGIMIAARHLIRDGNLKVIDLLMPRSSDLKFVWGIAQRLWNDRKASGSKG